MEEEVIEQNLQETENNSPPLEWEQLPWNRNERYIPTEYQIIDYERSWKKCPCGRVTRFNDNWCPSCGQKLGCPSVDE